MEKQVSNSSNVDNNNLKQSPNRSLITRKSKVSSSIPSKPLYSRKGTDVHNDIANNLAQNSFAKTPAPNIINNDNNNVNTTAPKHPSTRRQSFYQHGKKYGYHAPISPYDKEYVQGCNTKCQMEK